MNAKRNQTFTNKSTKQSKRQSCNLNAMAMVLKIDCVRASVFKFWCAFSLEIEKGPFPNPNREKKPTAKKTQPK